ncbi:amidohydrolase family protein [Dinghuibacter silviterrae]|uniref:L-fuconolactonase n=1 Tax=Dinghuibacter silviterrae TaxID=1539049 RepID=A0A4R8DKA0_9BACT|nr:amidohydrolase family protein [Dinghuibacter silviterrae]TDW97616.1 L-fuconolactonase [Dinghuibacter silviterrae]
MLRIDAHQHFWKYDPVRDSWMIGDIRRDFFPSDLQPLLEAQAFDGCVAVQADQSPAETAFLLGLAAASPFIKGVVGWVNLQASDIEEQLAHYRSFPLLKGFRHILQGEAQRDFMLRPDFLRGVGLLNRYGFTYDILIYADQIEYATEFARRFPDQPMVLDHMAKPDIKGYAARRATRHGAARGTGDQSAAGSREPAMGGLSVPPGGGPGDLPIWKKTIRSLASCENVCCKVSGLVTEADWAHWKPEDIHPFLDVVVEAFGPRRLMFGTDWPVCLLAASFEETVRVIQDYFAAFSLSEKAALFGGTASEFYKLT